MMTATFLGRVHCSTTSTSAEVSRPRPGPPQLQHELRGHLQLRPGEAQPGQAGQAGQQGQRVVTVKAELAGKNHRYLQLENMRVCVLAMVKIQNVCKSTVTLLVESPCLKNFTMILASFLTD